MSLTRPSTSALSSTVPPTKRLKNHVASDSEDEILESLTCGTCKLIALDPIKLCDSGHPICGLCAENRVTCGHADCGAGISNIRNRSLELLLGIVNLVCRNLRCQENVVGKRLRQHMTEQCEFRAIKCAEEQFNKCDPIRFPLLIPFHLYLNHLKTNHRIQTVQFSTISTSCPINFTSFANYANNFNMDSSFRKTIMMHGEKAFILNYSSTPVVASGDSFVIRFWVSALLEESEATKYSIKIKLGQSSTRLYPVKSRSSMEWNIAAHSIHRPLTAYEKSNDVGMILSGALANFSSRDALIGTQTWNYVWGLRCCLNGPPLTSPIVSLRRDIYLSSDSEAETEPEITPSLPSVQTTTNSGFIVRKVSQ